MNWVGEGHTDKGNIRKSNQDTFSLNNALSFWIVADGMGGHAGGDIASRLAVENIESYITSHLSSSHSPKEELSIPSLLSNAISSANHTIQEYVKQHPDYHGMGTTVVVLYISPSLPSQACLAHVGDSRAYVFRDGSLRQLTRDHTWIETHIRDGQLTPADVKGHPMEHVLLKAVGIEPTVEVELTTVPLQSRDHILLCTDGLTKMMNDQEISGEGSHLSSSHSPKEELSIPSLLSNAISSANHTIQEYVKQHPDYHGMGTTVVVLYISPSLPSQACLAHVGDSRAYVFRDGSLRQLTRDHTWIETHIRDGQLTPADVKGHPMEHVLLKAVRIDAFR